MDAGHAAHLARHDAQSDVADRRLRAGLEPLELSGDWASCIEGCHGSGIAIWLIIAFERPHLMHVPEERVGSTSPSSLRFSPASAATSGSPFDVDSSSCSSGVGKRSDADLRRREVEVRRVGGRVAFRSAAWNGSMKIVFGMSTIPSGICGAIPAAD